MAWMNKSECKDTYPELAKILLPFPDMWEYLYEEDVGIVSVRLRLTGQTARSIEELEAGGRNLSDYMVNSLVMEMKRHIERLSVELGIISYPHENLVP